MYEIVYNDNESNLKKLNISIHKLFSFDNQRMCFFHSFNQADFFLFAEQYQRHVVVVVLGYQRQVSMV